MSDVIYEPVSVLDELDKQWACKECPAIVSEQLCVQADIKIEPKVRVGMISTFCDEPIIGKCARVACSNEACEFTVSRNICVQIPLFYSAKAYVHPAGHISGAPEFEPCRDCTSED